MSSNVLIVTRMQDRLDWITDVIARYDSSIKTGCAVNGDQALRQLQDNSISYHVLIVDMDDPQNSGVGFVDVLREIPRFHDLPIIMLYTAPKAGAILRSYQLGAIGIVCTPGDANHEPDLTATVRDLGTLLSAAFEPDTNET